MTEALQPGWLPGGAEEPDQQVAQRFLTAMSSLAATVTVIAAASPLGERTGMTATAVCSLSTEPPMLVACINRSCTLARTLTRTGWFSVNLLGQNQEHVAATFAGRSGLAGDARFADGTWTSHPTGAPVLAGTAASCVCHVSNTLQQATHLVVIGSVHDVVLPEGPCNPLMYHMRRFTTVNEIPGE
jgi:flavin reductase (DIM6/NTAB) family NADH-FMN oxidoreductase RutF